MPQHATSRAYWLLRKELATQCALLRDYLTALMQEAQLFSTPVPHTAGPNFHLPYLRGFLLSHLFLLFSISHRMENR